MPRSWNPLSIVLCESELFCSDVLYTQQPDHFSLQLSLSLISFFSLLSELLSLGPYSYKNIYFPFLNFSVVKLRFLLVWLCFLEAEGVICLCTNLYIMYQQKRNHTQMAGLGSRHQHRLALADQIITTSQLSSPFNESQEGNHRNLCYFSEWLSFSYTLNKNIYSLGILG